MTSRRGSLLVAARLARREVRRHPWRHLLVTVLIFLPVVTALAAFSGVASWQSLEQQRRHFTAPPDGGFDYCCPDLGPDDDPADVMIDGTVDPARTELWHRTGDWLVTDMARADGQGPRLAGMDVTEASAGSAASPRFLVDQGRLPQDRSEIFLTAPLASEGRWSIGDEVQSVRSGDDLEVVGIGRLGENTARPAAAVTDQPGDYWTAQTAESSGVWWVALADGSEAMTESSASLTVWPKAGADRTALVDIIGIPSYNDVDGRVGPGLTLGAAAICAVVAVVASAAFAIASRRQLRSVGLLSTVGADPRTIRMAMVFQGAIPGLVAGLAAVGIGLVVVTSVNRADIVEERSLVAGSHLVLSGAGAVVAVLLAVGAGVAAAWQPARTLSRIPVLSALAGRRPVGPVPSGVPVAGLVLWGIGATFLMLGFGTQRSGLISDLQPIFLILGVAAIALGGVGIAPLLVAVLDGLAEHRRGTSRLALRGLARHRTQSAATVAALAVALAIPVGLLTARNMVNNPVERPGQQSTGVGQAGTFDDEGRASVPVMDRDGVGFAVRGDMRSPEAKAKTDGVADALGPDAAVIRTVALPDTDEAFHLVGNIDEADARRVLEPWAADAIAEGHLVSLVAGPSHLTLTSGGITRDFEAVRAPEGGLGSFEPGSNEYLVGTRALGGIGATRPPDSMVVVRQEPLTEEERTTINRLNGADERQVVRDPSLVQVQEAFAEGSQPDGVRRDVYIETYDAGQTSVPQTWDLTEWNRALAAAVAVSLLLALLVLTITLSLRAVDAEADQRAALAAGVAPNALRRQRAFEGVVLSLLGALLALPLGWLPVQAARLGVDSSVPHDIGGQQVMLTLSSPGLAAIPVLLAPALLAALLWTVVPSIAASARRARHAGPVDLVAPRW